MSQEKINIDQVKLSEAMEAVVTKLMNLGEADNEADKNTDSDAHKKGIIARDFGIKEWDWPQGVGLYGMTEIQAHYGDDRYDAFFDQWFKDNIDYGLPSKNINTTAPYLTLLGLADRLENKTYEQMCIERAQWLLDELPKTEEGGFQHVTSAIGDRNGIGLNDGEMWIDTIFMAVLFLNKMGHRHNRKDWISEALKQVLIHIKYLYDNKSGLFYHGWQFSERDNFGGIFWCRGNSWFTFGILEYLKDAEETLDAGAKEFIIDTFKAQARTLKELQAVDGLWHTVLDDPTSYTEVSGSAAIAKGFIKGYKMGILDESYKVAGDKAIVAIIDNVDKDGTVLNVSAGTGMGMDGEHYKNIIKAPMAYGQSLGLLALVEALV